MNVLMITLARGGSKGIHKKNMQMIGDRSLLDRVVDVGMAVDRSRRHITHAVSSDDDDILRAVYTMMQRNIDVEIVHRPHELALDTTSSADAIKHAVLELEARHEVMYDVIVELMCTAPFRPASAVDTCLDILEESGTDSVVTVERIFDHHPRRLKYINDQGVLCDVMDEIPESRRQDLTPSVYVRAGGTYVFMRSLLFERGRRWSENCRAVILPAHQALNIDEQRDLDLARVIELNNTNVKSR